MAAHALSNVKKEFSAKCDELTTHELIRLLVDKAEAQNRAGANNPPYTERSSSEEILAEVDLQGERYILVRLPKPDHPQVQLSPREQEIVRMVAQGHSNKVIADVLSISSWTVCTHLRRIFAKVGVTSRAAMVARLLKTRGGEQKRPHVATNNVSSPSR